MCTIGSIFKGGVTRTFKQCDLTDPTTFYPPQERSGLAGRYLAMTRQGRPGLWAGGNAHGLIFTAADNYTRSLPKGGDAAPHVLSRTSSHQQENGCVDSLFRAYETVVADFDNAAEAAAFLKDFYLHGDDSHPGPFESPDIALIADREQSLYLEYSPVGDFVFDSLGRILGEQGAPDVRTLSVGADHFVSTNNCRLFNTAVTYAMNPSTYLRLDRAQALLQQRPSHDGLHQLLHDQYFGRTELSICRVAQAPGQFYTQASVIFSASPDGLECEYVINANPRTGSWQTARLARAAH